MEGEQEFQQCCTAGQSSNSRMRPNSWNRLLAAFLSLFNSRR